MAENVCMHGRVERSVPSKYKPLVEGWSESAITDEQRA